MCHSVIAGTSTWYIHIIGCSVQQKHKIAEHLVHTMNTYMIYRLLYNYAQHTEEGRPTVRDVRAEAWFFIYAMFSSKIFSHTWFFIYAIFPQRFSPTRVLWSWYHTQFILFAKRWHVAMTASAPSAIVFKIWIVWLLYFLGGMFLQITCARSWCSRTLVTLVAPRWHVAMTITSALVFKFW